MTFASSTALNGLTHAYGGVDRLVAGLSRSDLLASTRCRGWLVADLLYHLLGDGQRALVALASPAEGPADVDFATYWRAFAEDLGTEHDPIPGIWSIRRSASAFRDGLGTTMLWNDTSAAAVRAAAAADPNGYVSTQGHTLTVADFLATLATEATIHHLDLMVELPAATPPDHDALAIVTATLDELAGTRDRPSAWTVQDYILKATGRLPLSAQEQTTLVGYPLLG